MASHRKRQAFSRRSSPILKSQNYPWISHEREEFFGRHARPENSSRFAVPSGFLVLRQGSRSESVPREACCRRSFSDRISSNIEKMVPVVLKNLSNRPHYNCACISLCDWHFLAARERSCRRLRTAHCFRFEFQVEQSPDKEIESSRVESRMFVILLHVG